MTSQNIEKWWHTLDGWSFVINTMQLFCQCAWIWYPVNSIEWYMVIFAVVCDFLLRNWRNQQFIFFFQNLHLFSFPSIYSLPCFPLKWRRYEFFPGGHPRRSGVTLRKPLCTLLQNPCLETILMTGRRTCSSLLWRKRRDSGRPFYLPVGIPRYSKT